MRGRIGACRSLRTILSRGRRHAERVSDISRKRDLAIFVAVLNKYSCRSLLIIRVNILFFVCPHIKSNDMCFYYFPLHGANNSDDNARCFLRYSCASVNCFSHISGLKHSVFSTLYINSCNCCGRDRCQKFSGTSRDIVIFNNFIMYYFNRLD